MSRADRSDWAIVTGLLRPMHQLALKSLPAATAGSTAEQAQPDDTIQGLLDEATLLASDQNNVRRADCRGRYGGVPRRGGSLRLKAQAQGEASPSQ
jgi:hypothetical protein